MSYYEWLFFPPGRRRMSPALFSIIKQGYLCTRVRQSSVCAEHTQTVLCFPQRTALMTICRSPGTKGEDAAGWHQYTVPLTCPPLQEGTLPSLLWEWERSHTQLTESGGSQPMCPRRSAYGLHQQKHSSYSLREKGLFSNSYVSIMVDLLEK